MSDEEEDNGLNPMEETERKREEEKHKFNLIKIKRNKKVFTIFEILLSRKKNTLFDYLGKEAGEHMHVVMKVLLNQHMLAVKDMYVPKIWKVLLNQKKDLLLPYLTDKEKENIQVNKKNYK